jgi:peptide/nickel transport system substrate-binding protein
MIGGKLVVAGEAETANPWTPANMNCDSFCQMRARTFYDPLVVVNEDLEVEPFLAESVEANADSTEFTIKLREGITFHDGEPFNADAAMDNINRNFTSLLIGAALKDIAKNDDGTVKMEKVDDYTFKVFTGLNGDPSNPIAWPLFPYYLGAQAGLMASPKWLADVDAGNADPTQAVGTGPFTLDSYAPGDKLIVKKNPDYWVTDDNGTALPYLDEIEFRVIVDSQVRSEALKSGDVNMIATSDSLVVGTLRDEGEFGYVNQDQFSETNYILMNLTKPYLADQSVRCALTQAIDKEDYNNVVLAGYGTPSNQMFTPGQEGYIEGDNGTPPYDPEAAAAAIAEWEAANGDLTINYSTTPTSTNLATAQYLADVWGQIGVDVTIDQIEQSELINNALFGAPAFDAFGWRNHAGLFVDQQFYWWHSSAAADPGELALNFGRLRDPEIDKLLEQSRSESDENARRDLAEQINQRFASQCFTIPLTSTQWGVFYDDSVNNIGRAPIPGGGGFMRDGAGFPGQVWLTAVFVTQ